MVKITIKNIPTTNQQSGNYIQHITFLSPLLIWYIQYTLDHPTYGNTIFLSQLIEYTALIDRRFFALSLL